MPLFRDASALHLPRSHARAGRLAGLLVKGWVGRAMATAMVTGQDRRNWHRPALVSFPSNSPCHSRPLPLISLVQAAQRWANPSLKSFTPHPTHKSPFAAFQLHQGSFRFLKTPSCPVAAAGSNSGVGRICPWGTPCLGPVGDGGFSAAGRCGFP